jgi:hypothetical protein
MYPSWCVVVVHHMKEPMSASAMSPKKGEKSLLSWKLIKGLGFIKLIKLVFCNILESRDLLPFYGIPMACASYNQDLEID